MMKKAILFWGVLLLAFPMASAQETFRISGIVRFLEDADIYMTLLTKTEWEKVTVMPQPPRTIVIKPTPEQKKTKKAAFEFIGISSGSYGIRVFQDINKNGELDRCPYGYAKEPYGSHRLAAPSDWKNIKFEVNEDIGGIDIQLR